MNKKLKSIGGIITITLLGTAICGCQSQQNPGTTLVLTSSGIVERNLTPSPNLKMGEILSIPQDTRGEKPEDKPKVAPIKTEIETQTNGEKVQPEKTLSVKRQRQLIELGTQPIRGYSNIEVYTEIPVPVQYSPAQVISSGGRGGQNVFIPATPTKMERVRLGPNSRISGFVDYGPTINVPVRTRNGVRYIQQKSPMPMPIIDRISVTYE
jgi:hypothetical protein